MSAQWSGKLRVVLFQEGDRWVAQGLEFDITASGRSIKEAQVEFGWAFLAVIVVDVEHGQQPLASTPKAPKEFWNLFQDAKGGLQAQRPLKVPSNLKIPKAYIVPRVVAEERLSA